MTEEPHAQDGAIRKEGTGRVVIGSVASLGGTQISCTNAPDVPSDGAWKTRWGAGLIEMERVACAGVISLSATALPATGKFAPRSK
jgi:hypothetical protein